VVEDNLRVIRRGFDELREVTEAAAEEAEGAPFGAAGAGPVRGLPASKAPLSDIQRFWADTGSLYARGMGNDNLADPFMALSLMPASTALFRDMSGIRTGTRPGCPRTARPAALLDGVSGHGHSRAWSTRSPRSRHGAERVFKAGHQPRGCPGRSASSSPGAQGCSTPPAPARPRAG
jgi:hypothetical protein